MAEEERAWLAKKNKTERAKAGRAAGGDATPEQKQERNRLEAHGASKRSEKEAKSRSRKQAAADYARTTLEPIVDTRFPGDFPAPTPARFDARAVFLVISAASGARQTD